MFKFIYSCRLADMGLATQAFHYCEVIAKGILLQPHRHSPVLISQLVQVQSSATPPAWGQGARRGRGRAESYPEMLWGAAGVWRGSVRVRPSHTRAESAPGALRPERRRSV